VAVIKGDNRIFARPRKQRNELAAEAAAQAQRDLDQTKAAWTRNIQLYAGAVWYAGGYLCNDDIGLVARVLDATSGKQVLKISILRTEFPSNPAVHGVTNKSYDAGAGLNGTEGYRILWGGHAAWDATYANFFLILLDAAGTPIDWPAAPATKLEFNVVLAVHA
jgi:hypothetical protein